MSDVSKIDTYGAKLVLLPYMLATIGSCLYTIILGVYNGDFIQCGALFPLPVLLVIAVLTIIPYTGIYGLYKRYRFRETEDVPDKFRVAIIRNITWFLLLVHIGLLFTRYDQMGTSIEIDGGLFSYIRSAFFKLMVRPRIITYLLIPNSRKNLVVAVPLLFIHTILAHSLGGFFILLLILLFGQGKKVKSSVKRNFLSVLTILYLVPIVVSSAYNVCAQLRGQGGMSEASNMDIIVGKLCGRINSFSNSAYILQNSSQNVYDLELIPDFFCFYDTLHYWGYRPEFKSTGFYVEEQIRHSKLKDSSTMPGVIGVLIMSYVKSPYIFLFNLFLMTFLLIIIFSLTKRIGFPNASGIVYILTIEFAMSRDISALSNTIYTLLVIWSTLSISNIIIWKRKRKRRRKHLCYIHRGIIYILRQEESYMILIFLKEYFFQDRQVCPSLQRIILGALISGCCLHMYSSRVGESVHTMLYSQIAVGLLNLFGCFILSGYFILS